jgi:hypothetical protein
MGMNLAGERVFGVLALVIFPLIGQTRSNFDEGKIEPLFACLLDLFLSFCLFIFCRRDRDGVL